MCTIDKVTAFYKQSSLLACFQGRRPRPKHQTIVEDGFAWMQMLIKGIRSFSPDNTVVLEFYKPLTLIVGHNGAGKTVSLSTAGYLLRLGDGVQHLLQSVLSADHYRVLEASLHRRAAAQYSLRPKLYPRPQGVQANMQYLLSCRPWHVVTEPSATPTGGRRV